MEKMVKMAGTDRKGNPMKWREAIRLRFIIPTIKEVLGVWEFNSFGAKSTIKEIVGAFDLVSRATNGKMQMIPFDLTVQMVKSQKAGVQDQYPVVSLTPNAGQDNLQILANYGGDLLSFGLLTNEKIQALVQPKEALRISGTETIDVSHEAFSDSE